MPSTRHEAITKMLLAARPNARANGLNFHMRRLLLGVGRDSIRKAIWRHDSFHDTDDADAEPCCALADDFVDWIARDGVGFVPDAWELLAGPYPDQIGRADYVKTLRCYEVEVSNPHLSSEKVQRYGAAYGNFDATYDWDLELILIDRWGIPRWVDLGAAYVIVLGAADYRIKAFDPSQLGEYAATLPFLCASSDVPGGASAPFGRASEAHTASRVGTSIDDILHGH